MWIHQSTSMQNLELLDNFTKPTLHTDSDYDVLSYFNTLNESITTKVDYDDNGLTENTPSNGWFDFEFRGVNVWAIIATLLVVCTAGGNILVCLAIYLERRLQNVTNYFLMSLAITDCMVAVLVMPLGILSLVNGKCYVFIFI